MGFSQVHQPALDGESSTSGIVNRDKRWMWQRCSNFIGLVLSSLKAAKLGKRSQAGRRKLKREESHR